MTIENKELFDLFKSMFKSGKIDSIYKGAHGLFLEGFDGGITAYVTDSYTVYRKTFYGDNKEAFVAYFDAWETNAGKIDISEISALKTSYNESRFKAIKAYFNNDRIPGCTVVYKEFKKAVKGVDAINKGDKTHDIVLSVHNGKFDIASWTNNGDTASWQLELEDAYIKHEGVVCVNKKYLDGIKSDIDNRIGLSYSELDGKTVLHIRGGIDAVIMSKEVDPAMFMEVMEYEYHAPEKPVEKPIEVMPEKNETSIAKNYIGKIPELKILDGDIKGARVVFEQIEEPVIEQKPELKPVELEQPLIEQKPVEKIELKLVKTEKPKTARQARNTGNRALKMRQCDTGWTYNRLGTKQIKVCGW